MTVEILKTFQVQNYDQAFQLYLDGEFGCIEQRMPENLIKKSNGEDYDNIKSLLDTDPDNMYNIIQLIDGDKFAFFITIIGFAIHKSFDREVKKYFLQFGEDGKWEEVVLKDDADDEYSDGFYAGNLSITGDTIEEEHTNQFICDNPYCQDGKIPMPYNEFLSCSYCETNKPN